jgi:phosphatidyl-myo-inositol dimannoside synthase
LSDYLIISTEFPPGPGGIGKHAYSVAKGLIANGARVTVISDMNYASEDEINKFIQDHKSIFEISRIRQKGLLTYIGRLVRPIRFVRKNKFKKIIVTGKFSIWAGGMLKLLFGNKVIVEGFIHGSEARLPAKLQQYFINLSLRSIDKIWCVSNFTRSLLPDDARLMSKTGVIPNGLNIDDWPPSQSANPLDWKGYPGLLTVGNISYRKGQHCVVKALPAILKVYPDVQYHIVGMDKNADTIIKIAKDLNVEKHITIHGKLSAERLIQAYESADVFCMLSENQANGEVEGFGIAILEANIMGLPAVGSKGCGIEDAIKDGYNGYLTDPHDSAAILKSINSILHSDPAARKKNCKEWANKHDWNLLAQKLL